MYIPLILIEYDSLTISNCVYKTRKNTVKGGQRAEGWVGQGEGGVDVWREGGGGGGGPPASSGHVLQGMRAIVIKDRHIN